MRRIDLQNSSLLVARLSFCQASFAPRRSGSIVLACAILAAGCAPPAVARVAREPAPPPVDRTEVAGFRLIPIEASVPGSGAPHASPDGAVARSILPAMSDVSRVVAEGAVRCPPEMTFAGGRVCIDRWEASIVRRSGEREEVWSPFRSLDGETGFRAVSRAGVVPQGYVSGEQAEVACRASGKRLCTPSEWQTACKGSRGTTYPYGAERKVGTCNDAGRKNHPVLEAARAAGIHADKLWTEGMNLPEINQLPDALLATGARDACVSDEGAFDMVGNLHEWVADRDGTFRGGFYMDTEQNGEGCAYQTTAHDFSYHDYSTGFRCCLEPDSTE